jgi:integrase
MSIRVTQTKKGKTYAARVHLGAGKYKLLEPRQARKEAKEDEARWYLSRRSPERVMGSTFAKRWLREYGEKNKKSSYDHAAGGVREWLKTFGTRAIGTIGRDESIEWAEENRWAVDPCITMLNAAIEEEIIDRNPLRGQGRRGKGRTDNEPLKEADVDRLAEIAQEKHGIGAFVAFTAYTGMRVGEVFPLEWADIDFHNKRVKVHRRLYDGELDLPKSNKKREVVLLPQARDALMGLDRDTPWVFLAKRGGRMSQGALTYYWQKIEAAFGKDVDPHELRHFCAHYMYVTLGMPAYDVAQQLGHKDESLIIERYGHGSSGALDRITAAVYEADNRHLRAVK